MLGLGLGLGLTGGGGSPIADIVASLIGQSLHEHLVTQFSGAGATSIVSAFTEFGTSCTVKDGATGGSSILRTVNDTNHWVDDTDPEDLVRGTAYTTFLNSLTTAEKAGNNVIAFWAQTTADADALNAGTISKAEQKAGLEQVIAWVREDIPLLVDFVINLAHAHNVKPDAGWQLSRDIQLEVIAEGKAKRGVEFYDLDQTDGVHLTETGNVEFGRRIGRRAAQIAGYSLLGAQGPYVRAVTLYTDQFTVDVVQDEGTALATPVSLTTSREYIIDDGTLVEPIAISRPSANQLRYTLPEGDAPVFGSVLEFLPVYGSLNLGGLTSKNVIKDNATNALPLQSGRFTMVNADPIQVFSNLAEYIHARGSAKDYSSGALVETIYGLAGGNCAEFGGAGNGPSFSTDRLVFSGTDQLLTDTAVTNDPSQTLIIAGYSGDDVTTKSAIATYAIASGVTNQVNAQIYFEAGELRWSRNQATGFETIMTIGTDEQFIIAAVFESLTVAKIYRAQDVSSGDVTPFVTFDPRDNYGTNAAKIMLGRDQSAGLNPNYSLQAMARTSDAKGSTDIAAALAYLDDIL
jgi:hypothetical protein